MWLVIEALDVLFFRESKPFTAGENFRATSAFPPSAEPFVGALRSRVLAAAGIDFHGYFHLPATHPVVGRIGTPEALGQLHVRGPFLVRRDSRETWCLPVPRDVLVLKTAHNRWTERLQPVDLAYAVNASPVTTEAEDKRCLRPLALAREIQAGTRAVPPDQWWITAEGLQGYLLGQPVSGTDLIEPPSLWHTEPRSGIERGAGRTTEQGMFYAAEFVRMEATGRLDHASAETAAPHAFLLGVHGIGTADLGGPRGMLALGGMRRAAEYGLVEAGALHDQIRALTEDSARRLETALQGQTGFKLCVTTPACFDGGWRPDFLHFDGRRYAGQAGGCAFHLVAAAVGKPVYAAGWDYSRRRPKAMRRSVPAGSVYFLAADAPLDRSAAAALQNQFHAQSLCQDWSKPPAADGRPPLTEAGKRGAGFTLLGVW